MYDSLEKILAKPILMLLFCCMDNPYFSANEDDALYTNLCRMPCFWSRAIKFAEKPPNKMRNTRNMQDFIFSRLQPVNAPFYTKRIVFFMNIGNVITKS